MILATYFNKVTVSYFYPDSTKMLTKSDDTNNLTPFLYYLFSDGLIGAAIVGGGALALAGLVAIFSMSRK